MNIPSRKGIYNLNIGNNLVKIGIDYVLSRLSKMDRICGLRGDYKKELQYDVNVVDNNGNIIDRLTTTDEDYYKKYISSMIGKEHNTTSDPNDIMGILKRKFIKETDLYVVEEKFNGIVKGKMKFTFYVSAFESSSNEIIEYFKKLGVECKIAPKAKYIRCNRCLVISLYVPMDITLEENKKYNYMKANKQVIRLTESDLHRVIKESVNNILKEGYGNTMFDKKLPEVIEFLEELKWRLENGLLEVNGFVGGNRMFAISSLMECIGHLKKMVGNLYPTDK